MIERPSAKEFHTFSHDPFVLVGGTVHDPKNGLMVVQVTFGLNRGE